MPRCLLIILALITGCAACARASASPTASEFSDDFTSPLSGWDRYAGSDVVTDYRDGAYVMEVNRSGVEVWATPGLDWPAAAVQVDAFWQGGPPSGEFGLICRYGRSGDKASFYYFVITGEGLFTVGKVVRGQRTDLTPGGGFQPAPGLSGDLNAPVQLAAQCAGQRLRFDIDGQPAADLADESLSRGGVGLIAGTFEDGGLSVSFDNFRLARP